MDAATADRQADQQDGALARALRYLVRVPFLLLHLFVGLPLAVLCCAFPGVRDWRIGDDTLRGLAIRRWSKTLCRIFGMRVQRLGELHDDPVMLLANHVTWMDIEVLHAIRAIGFVAKAEIKGWPVIGWLATIGGTVYHARGSRSSQEAVSGALTERLVSGRSVAIFPEGRTSTGEEILPFHGRLIKAAVDADCPVQAIAIGYFRNGELRNHEVAFGHRENFLQNFFRLLGMRTLDVDIVCMPAMETHGRGRKELAALAREQVVEALESRDAT